MNKPPDILYKYSSAENAVLILNSQTIKLSPPCAFNDPFEILPGGYDILKASILQRMAKEKCESYRYYKMVTSQFGLNISYDTYLHFLKICPDIINDVAKSLKAAFENRDFKTLREQVSNEIALTCFSVNSDNILMWSHYANQHKGVVLGFKNTIATTWYKVAYSDYRIIITFDVDQDDIKYKESVQKVLTTKSKIWEYEKEYRYLKQLNSLKYENNMYFDPFKKKDLAEVILGANISNEDKSKVLQVSKSYSDVKIIQAEIDNKKYKLNFKKIN